NNSVAVAKALRAKGLHGRMAVTEAGRLPYYSGWTAEDLWGLNTAYFAARMVQPEDIQSLNADLVVVHWPENGDRCPPRSGPSVSRVRSWDAMAANVVSGIAPLNYTLVMLPWDSAQARRDAGLVDGQGRYDCYFVDNQSPVREDILAVLYAHN